MIHLSHLFLSDVGGKAPYHDGKISRGHVRVVDLIDLGLGLDQDIDDREY